MNIRSVWRAAVLVLATIAVLSSTAVAVDGYTGPAESANARFVVASYQQLLGRDPDTASLDRHLGQIAAGGEVSRQAMTETLLFGPEGASNEVNRAYESILNRPAETVGKTYWTNHLRNHDVLDLRVLLMSSNEYFNKAGGTNVAWLQSLYRDVLERNPEPTGMAYWQAVAAAGTKRALIVAAFYLSSESLGNRTDEYYQLILHRSPTGGERQAGASLIASNGERALYARLWASDETFEQFFDLAWSPR